MPFKAIRQHDQRDCAAACLAMVARHHGLKYTLSKFRELTKTDQRGANLYGLVNGAKEIGLDAEALSGTRDDLFKAIVSGQVTLPFVAHIRQIGVFHFVVVCAIRESALSIADPARGLRELSADEFSALWTGYIVTFQRPA